MSRFLLASLLFFGSLPVFAVSPQELFLKAKDQFKLGAYAEALQTLDSLQSQSEKPGNESYRAALRPGFAFYRGASLAALGRTEEAIQEFEQFLSYQPNASLDPAVYSKKVIGALDEARKRIGKKNDQPAETASLAASFRVFKFDPLTSSGKLDETWVNGPVRYLLNSEETLELSRISDPVSRSEFVTDFWKRRDPHPETPENEFREEFEKRVAFADARMAQDERRGSLTDRGMVFILLGPPTYIGRKPIATGEDTADPQGMVRHSSHDVSIAVKGARTSGEAVSIVDNMNSPTNKLPDADGNYREVWHYRREELPKGVSYLQVDFEFITRKGYGLNVLQREEVVLATLETARRSMRSGIVPSRSAP